MGKLSEIEILMLEKNSVDEMLLELYLFITNRDLECLFKQTIFDEVVIYLKDQGFEKWIKKT